MSDRERGLIIPEDSISGEPSDEIIYDINEVWRGVFLVVGNLYETNDSDEKLIWGTDKDLRLYGYDGYDVEISASHIDRSEKPNLIDVNVFDEAGNNVQNGLFIASWNKDGPVLDTFSTSSLIENTPVVFSAKQLGDITSLILHVSTGFEKDSEDEHQVNFFQTSFESDLVN